MPRKRTAHIHASSLNRRLTKPLLEAMSSALNSALAGGGFDGGDFAGCNRDDFERALEWVAERLGED